MQHCCCACALFKLQADSEYKHTTFCDWIHARRACNTHYYLLLFSYRQYYSSVATCPLMTLPLNFGSGSYSVHTLKNEIPARVCIPEHQHPVRMSKTGGILKQNEQKTYPRAGCEYCIKKTHTESTDSVEAERSPQTGVVLDIKLPSAPSARGLGQREGLLRNRVGHPAPQGRHEKNQKTTQGSLHVTRQ